VLNKRKLPIGHSLHELFGAGQPVTSAALAAQRTTTAVVGSDLVVLKKQPPRLARPKCSWWATAGGFGALERPTVPRGLGYGYYERHMVDLMADPAWAILLKEHRDIDGVDLVRFTFELDEAVEEINALVAAVFATAASRT